MRMTSANAKALEVPRLGDSHLPDGNIIFNQAIGLDFNNSDGVNPKEIDFETVAAHEIGHVLGFHTVIDDIDTALEAGRVRGRARDRFIQPAPLDLFRFNADDPDGVVTSGDEFSSRTRWLAPGGNPYSAFGERGNVGMSSGVQHGDGNQAVHWRVAEPSERIGLMSPMLPVGFSTSITEFDLTAMDLIGWDVESDAPPFQAGDADRDYDFDQSDLVRILRAKKYRSGLPATWERGRLERPARRRAFDGRRFFRSKRHCGGPQNGQLSARQVRRPGRTFVHESDLANNSHRHRIVYVDRRPRLADAYYPNFPRSRATIAVPCPGLHSENCSQSGIANCAGSFSIVFLQGRNSQLADEVIARCSRHQS